jgi:outer membrane protein assembly factor BamA
VVKAQIGDGKKGSSSWIPILGYNTTYQSFGGGGYFYSKEEFSFGLNGIGTQTKALKFELSLGNRISEKWTYSTKHELGHGFEPYFGEGNQTRVEDRHDIVFWRLISRVNFDYELAPRFYIGPLAELRARRNPMQSDTVANQIHSREDALGVGLFQQIDFRNLPDSPTMGWYESITLMAVPSLSPADHASTFGVFDLNLRFFQQIVRDLVFAVQFSAGTRMGQATYLYTPRLGGTNQLRGYLDNRFRGKDYYLQQNEVRFPLWKQLSGVVFLEFGEASNDGLGQNPNVSSGFGLRFGLPPDHLKKIRLDLGFGKDQKGIFLDFGHSF